MEVVNMPAIFDEIDRKGVALKDNRKYDFFINVLIKIWDENSTGEDTNKFTRHNAKRFMVRMYDYYNDDENYFDSLGEAEKRAKFSKYVYNTLLR